MEDKFNFKKFLTASVFIMITSSSSSAIGVVSCKGSYTEVV